MESENQGRGGSAKLIGFINEEMLGCSRKTHQDTYTYKSWDPSHVSNVSKHWRIGTRRKSKSKSVMDRHPIRRLDTRICVSEIWTFHDHFQHWSRAGAREIITYMYKCMRSYKQHKRTCGPSDARPLKTQPAWNKRDGVVSLPDS